MLLIILENWVRGLLKWSELKSLSCVQLFATPWIVAYYAPPSMGFSRQEYWSGLPFPSLGDFPNAGIEPTPPASPALQADSLPLSHPTALAREDHVTQWCLTLCDPMDCSLPGSSIHGVFQARILEWVAMSFSRGFSWPMDWTCVSCSAGRFFTTEPPGKPMSSCD